MDLIEPMLAMPSTGSSNRRPILLADLAGRADWLAQEKLDGLRALLYTEGGSPRLYNRNGREITGLFPELRNIRMPGVVLDGEIVARDGLFQTVATRAKQTSGFQAAAKRNPCYFVAFDFLRSNGTPLMHLPLTTRTGLMRGVIGRRRNVRPVRQSRNILDLWHEVTEAGGEGIIAKQAKSLYLPGQRASTWVKFKATHRLTAIAIGYERGLRRDFGAINLALMDGTEPVLIGRVGTGWNAAQETELQRRLDAGEFFPVEVEALNRTKENVLRFPVWRGIPSDRGLEAATADQLEALPVYT